MGYATCEDFNVKNIFIPDSQHSIYFDVYFFMYFSEHKHVTSTNKGCCFLLREFEGHFKCLLDNGDMPYSSLVYAFFTEKVCPNPGRPERGHQFGPRYKTVGSTMRFFCQSGYKLHGSKVRTCLENKEWSGSLTTCQNGSKLVNNVTPH